jgi:hypothetical protein
VRDQAAFELDDKGLAFELIDVPERLSDNLDLFLEYRFVHNK